MSADEREFRSIGKIPITDRRVIEEIIIPIRDKMFDVGVVWFRVTFITDKYICLEGWKVRPLDEGPLPTLVDIPTECLES